MNKSELKSIINIIEDLEEFLIADFGQQDWNTKFFQDHFKICKNQITELKEVEKK